MSCKYCYTDFFLQLVHTKELKIYLPYDHAVPMFPSQPITDIVIYQLLL